MQASDEELVSRAVAAGDQAAFGELVRRHQSAVRSWLRQLTRNPASADDIAQETFIKAWDRLASFQGKGRFVAWLMKIAYSEFLMSHRRSRSAQRLSEALAGELAEPPHHDPAGDESAATDLQRMLAAVSADERTALVLCYAHGMSHGEASDITGWPVGTVKSHVHRAKEKIRQRFLAGEDVHD